MARSSDTPPDRQWGFGKTELHFHSISFTNRVVNEMLVGNRVSGVALDALITEEWAMEEWLALIVSNTLRGHRSLAYLRPSISLPFPH